MATHHCGAAFPVDFPLVYFQEMFRLENFLTFVTLVRSLLLELNDVVGGLHFMAS